MDRSQFTQTVRRMGYESGMVNRLLGQVGFSSQESQYFAARSQEAPKEVMHKISATMKARGTENKSLLGKVRRCVNNINKLVKKYRKGKRSLDRQGVDTKAIEKKALATA